MKSGYLKKMKNKSIYLVRHSETSWTLNGRHTGKTDIPLTKKGEQDAALVGKKLCGKSFRDDLSSPLERAKKTCEIVCQTAGFLKKPMIIPELEEWDYGDYEGMTTEEIWKKAPDWNIFSQGALGGQSPSDIHQRASKVLDSSSLV